MTKDTVASGIENYIKRLKKCQEIYAELLATMGEGVISRVTDRKMFRRIIENFVTALDQDTADSDLAEIYDVALHTDTGALIIANKGATLFSLSDKHSTPHLVRHIGLCIYMPGLGMEYANVGIIGNVYDDKFVLRTESACTPSFIFGSQRCNCHHQWQNVQELAASFNETKAPATKDGDEFERWVRSQYKYDNGKHIYQGDSQLGFVMLHIDSQNGMGSGYTKGEFVFDLAERAAMRHRGEYTAEQTQGVTMYGGFTALGLDGDPRGSGDSAGYKITPIILDYLGVNKEVIMLTNNPLKMRQMSDFGYQLHRVKTVGEINVAGATEARERGSEFCHFDIDDNLVSFKQEYDRVRKEILRLVEVGHEG
jgi:GTP cyclohydrolase II